MSPYRLYLIICGLGSFAATTAFTLNLVYQATVVGLSPFQLVLVGTLMEAVCFVAQVPTGVIADLYSRRLSVVTGYLLMGAGLLVWGLLPAYTAILVANVIWAVGVVPQRRSTGAGISAAGLFLVPAVALFALAAHRSPSTLQRFTPVPRSSIRHSHMSATVKGFSHMHVLGLELIELRQWLGHEFVATTHVEANRVLGRCSGDDNLGVTGVAGDQVQLVRQTTADARRPERLADVEERELRCPGAKVWYDHSNPNQPSFREGAECDPARVEVMLEGVPLRLDGVLAVPVRVPGGRAPAPPPLYEFGPTLLVDEVDTLGTVDLGDPRQLYAR